MNPAINRRHLLAGSVALTTALCGSRSEAVCAPEEAKGLAAKPASNLAGKPWPVWNETDQQGLVDVLNSGQWGRLGGRRVKEFEEALQTQMQARFCVATSSGTTALLTALGALNIGPGDQVIMPPYTFVATFNAITSSYALPVFVDSDLESFQIDASKIAAAMTDQTRLLLPVHIGGTPCNLDEISRVAEAHKVPFVEDACQAPFAMWRGRPVGTHGIGGCFSFQASKNLTSGEGGAVVTNDEDFAHRCYNYHTPGGPRPAPSSGRGSNHRLTEFQGTVLLTQLARVAQQAKLRDENAAYLSDMLSKIPGITPAKWYEGCERSAWHLYMFRYDAAQFNGMSREDFLRELRKHDISGSSGYTSLNKTPHVLALVKNPHYQRLYGKDFMVQWAEKNHCPVNDQLCEQAVWFSQYTLLESRSQMERIASSIAAIQRSAKA